MRIEIACGLFVVGTICCIVRSDPLVDTMDSVSVEHFDLNPNAPKTIEEFKKIGRERGNEWLNKRIEVDWDDKQMNAFKTISSVHRRTLNKYIADGTLPKEILDMNETEQLKLMRQKLCIEKRKDYNKNREQIDIIVDDVCDELGR